MKTSIVVQWLIFFQLVIFNECYLFPKNHEVTYRYKALIETGTVEPESASSDFYVEALLTVINREHINIVTLKEVKHGTYADTLDKRENISPIPEGSQSILKPFVLKFNPQGELTKIETQADDETWSKNIKKGIANLFQVDLQWKNSIDIANKTKNFTTKEKSVLGNCDVYYTVNKEENIFTVIKGIEFQKCESNDKLKIKHSKSNNIHKHISSLNLLTYEIEDKNDDVLIRSINGYNEINYDMNLNQILSAYVHQNITLVDSKENTDKLDLKTETMNKESLAFKYSDENNLNRLIGKKIDVTTDDILHNFQEIWNFFNIKGNEPDGIVEKLLMSLKFANKKQLEEYFDLLSDIDDKGVFNMKHFYVKVLSHVGTHDSVSFLLDLIKNDITDERHSLSILTNVPFYIKFVDDPLLLEYQNFVKTENLTENIRTMATLSFGTVLSRVDNEMKTKIVDELISDALTCKDYRKCFTAICTLSNTKNQKAFEFLEDIVMNEFPKFSDEMRLLAMTVLRNHYSIEDDRILKHYWPVFVNTDETIQIRFAAMNTLLMAPAKYLGKIHEFLNNDEEKQMYNYFKLFLKTYIEQNPNDEHAKDIFKLLQRPVNKRYQDFYNTIGYNNLVKGMNISIRGNGELMNDNFWTLYGEYNFEKVDYVSVKNAFNINIKVLNNISHNKTESGNIAHFFELTSDDNGYVEIDLLLFKNNYISFAAHMPSNEISKWRTHIKYIFYYDYEFSQNLYGNEFVMTSMGIPIFVSLESPLITKKRDEIEELFVTSDSMLGILSEQLSLTEYNVMFFNPILDVWHGVTHKESFISKLPIFSPDMYERSLNLTFYKNNTYVEVNTYNYEFMLDNKFEEKNCEDLKFKCGSVRKAKKNPMPEEKRELFKKTSQLLDVSYGLDVYGCKKYDFSELKPVSLKDIVHSYSDIRVGDFYIAKPFLKFHDYMTNIFDTSREDLCKMKIYIQPNHIQSQLNFDIYSSTLFYRALTEESEEKNLFEIQFKFSENGTRLIKMTDSETTYIDFLFKVGNIPKLEYDMKINSGKIIDEKSEHETTLLETKFVTEFSDEQRNPEVYKQTYQECMNKEIGSLRCILEQTFARNILLKLYYKDLPTSHKECINSFLEKIDNKYAEYLTINAIDTEVDENTLKLDITFPITSNTMNMSIETSHTDKSYNLIPMKNNYLTLWLTPFNPLFTFENKLRYFIFKYQVCEVHMDHIKNLHNVNGNELFNNWTKLLEKKSNYDLHLISAKKENNKLYVRYQNDDMIDMIITYDEGFSLSVDNKTMKPTKDEILYDKWYKSVIMPDHQRFLTVIPGVDWIIDYSKNNIKIHFIVSSRESLKYEGQCL